LAKDSPFVLQIPRNEVYKINPNSRIKYMKIPDQVLSMLSGADVVLVPPPQEGTQPTEAEDFIQAFIEPLMMLEMGVAIEPETGMGLVFNPTYHNPDVIGELALAGRLAEYVNGLGNNEKPINPEALVRVTSPSGEPIRDILVDSREKAQTAVARNETGDHVVEVLPADQQNLTATLANRSPTGSMPEHMLQ
jgi:hypothetical protein